MKISKKNSVAKKIVFSCLIVAAVLGVSYLIYYLVNYTFNKKYTKYLVGIDYAAGSDFKAISDSSRPADLPDGYVLAAKNDRLRLYYNESTTEVAVYDEKTAKLTYSNPQNLENADYDNNGFFTNMKSQFKLYFYDRVGSQMINEMSSYEFCTSIPEAEDGSLQYSVEAIPNGIRVLYKVGKLGDASIIANYITSDTFDDLSKKLEEYDEANGTRNKRTFTNLYRESKDLKGFYALTEAGTKKSTKRNLEKILGEIGWTASDFTREMEASGQDYDVPVSFNIPLEYTLDNDKLIVNICTDHIVENGGASLMYIDLLPYFDAQYYINSEGGDPELNADPEFSDYIEVLGTDGNNVKVKIESDFAEDYKNCYFRIYKKPEEAAASQTPAAETANDTPAEGDAGESAETGESSTETAGSDTETTGADENDSSLAEDKENSADAESADSGDTKTTGTDDDTETTGTEDDEKDVTADLEPLTEWKISDEDVKELELEAGEYILEYEGYIIGTPNGETTVSSLEFSVGIKKHNLKGYYFVPNGSGSLINVNSKNCDNNNDYFQYMYGEDYVMNDTEVVTAELDSAKLPVYGWSTDNTNKLVILSRGESLARLAVLTANDETCKESDSFTNYNTAYARYYLRSEGIVAMSTADKFTVWNDNIFDTQLTQKYCFLDDEHEGYSGMANYYRDYLIETGALNRSEETKEENISLFLDIIGAIRGDVSTFGVTHESVIPVTTFKQAEKIADSFFQNNVRNLIVNYQGWMNGGYYHDTPDDIRVIKKLGGKSSFEDLNQHIVAQGGKLYGDMAITKVSYAAKDYQYTLESSRIYGSGYIAAYGKTSPTSYSNAASLGYRANLYDVLSPKFYEKYVTGALEDMKKINVSGISFRDLGTYLYSDMRKKCIINREHTKEITEAMLQLTLNSKKSIMLNSALGYALAYADEIINAPIGDNNYVCVNCEVPFYEMVIHGYINYSGESINLSQDTTAINNILSCIEYGASPHFTLSYAEATTMKYTALNNLYATNYVNWVDIATDIYTEVNSALAPVTQASVIKHEILDDANNVRKITYDNGVIIYVNYSDKEFAADGLTLSPKSYWVEK